MPDGLQQVAEANPLVATLFGAYGFPMVAIAKVVLLALTTGVWMGNNNQEPMSNVLGQGLFSADGPLYLWNEFMTRALNEPWAWNDQTPVGQTSFDQLWSLTTELFERVNRPGVLGKQGGVVGGGRRQLLVRAVQNHGLSPFATRPHGSPTSTP